MSVKKDHNDWVPRDEAAAALGLKKSTFNKYLSTNKIPAHAVKKGLVKVFHLPTLKGLN